MGEVLPFRRPKGIDAQQGEGLILCKSKFHKWEVVNEKQFDVRLGRLITLLRCQRCGVTKTEAR